MHNFPKVSHCREWLPPPDQKDVREKNCCSECPASDCQGRVGCLPLQKHNQVYRKKGFFRTSASASPDREPGGKPVWECSSQALGPGSGEAARGTDHTAETTDTICTSPQVSILFLMVKVIQRCPKLQNGHKIPYWDGGIGERGRGQGI